MELASKFCYIGEENEEELFDDETLNNDEDRRRIEKQKNKSKSNESTDDVLALSDDEDNYTYNALPHNRVRKVRKADPNILAINLGTLSSDAVVLFTGDPVFCTCGAALSQNSHINPTEFGQIWDCEYCGTPVVIKLDPEELPKGESLDYILGKPEVKSNQDDIIIFCVDISGSMCTSSEVTGDVKIRVNNKLAQSLDEFVEKNNGLAARQFLPHERTNISYVSRLQCVQAAVSSQIELLSKEHPNKRVGIVTFNNEVTIYLPGGIRHVVTGDKLNDFDYLTGVAESLGIVLETPVDKSSSELNNVVVGLEETGSTALGPALLASISIAGVYRGSSVVLCTDGIANVGLGNLENGNGPDSEASQFYRKVSEVALRKGVAVSIVSIKGTNASMEHLAKISMDTRGYNDVVDPLNLTKNFNFILQNSIIATDVSATMYLNKGFTFRHEKNVQNNCKATRVVGNSTKESSITFEYYPADKEIVNQLKQVHFQVQISFTKLDGSRCMRIISKTSEVTREREVAEKHVNVNVIGLHAQVQTAQLATEGQYTKARMMQKANMRMVRRGIASEEATDSQMKQYALWNQEATRLNSALKATKIQEKHKGITYDSAEEDVSDEEVGEKEKEKEKVKEKRQEEKSMLKYEKKQRIQQERQRSRYDNDTVSNVLYQAQNPIYSTFSHASNPLYSETTLPPLRSEQRQIPPQLQPPPSLLQFLQPPSQQQQQQQLPLPQPQPQQQQQQQQQQQLPLPLLQRQPQQQQQQQLPQIQPPQLPQVSTIREEED